MITLYSIILLILAAIIFLAIGQIINIKQTQANKQAIMDFTELMKEIIKES